MKRKLTPKEIVFDASLYESRNKEKKNTPNFKDVYRKIDRALSINKEGYNLYLIESFSKEKLDKLIKHIEYKYKDEDAPKDICYVTLGDEKKPEPLFVTNGKGEILKEAILSIKNNYIEVIDDFYRESTQEEKDALVDEVQERRTDRINTLMDAAKKDGFEVKTNAKGFAFIPLKGDEAMTESEYESLEEEAKDYIVKCANNLKEMAEDILDELKEVEGKSIKKIKKIYTQFLADEMEEYKNKTLIEFITDDDAYEFLEKFFYLLEEEIVSLYTMSLDDDENEIYETLNKYNINVLVDNKNNSSPPVIFEDDPTLNNLIGVVEYENNNGVYTTDISLINAGSVIKANSGCLIIRLNSLAINPISYHYLKKILLNNKVSFESNKSYLEAITLNGLKPEPIPVKIKVILIGDYESYDVLYNSDEDFKRIFPLRVEMPSILSKEAEYIEMVRTIIDEYEKDESILKVSEEAFDEIIKCLSRAAGDRNKILIEDSFLERILLLANNYAEEKKKFNIDKEDILKVVYEEDPMFDDIISMYEDKKIVISVVGEKVGSINGLAVLNTGYCSCGKPMRITCVASKGSGNIIDIQKESSLSGKIHEKSINILKGLLTSVLNPYEAIPVDFHLSFEQTYGLVEGDSASIAEIVCLLSALSKRPIKQNIAVTGSINQFGEVQPIGGVNEKIEGFFNICNAIDTIKDKGVLIPLSNKNDLVLNQKVEEAIEKGIFNIYTMESLQDAIEILILNENEDIENFYKDIEGEISKYKKD